MLEFRNQIVMIYVWRLLLYSHQSRDLHTASNKISSDRDHGENFTDDLYTYMTIPYFSLEISNRYR